MRAYRITRFVPIPPTTYRVPTVLRVGRSGNNAELLIVVDKMYKNTLDLRSSYSASSVREPLDRNSTQHCRHHLEQKRERQREKAKVAGKYPRGKHPNTVAALAKATAKRKEEPWSEAEGKRS